MVAPACLPPPLCPLQDEMAGQQQYLRSISGEILALHVDAALHIIQAAHITTADPANSQQAGSLWPALVPSTQRAIAPTLAGCWAARACAASGATAPASVPAPSSSTR